MARALPDQAFLLAFDRAIERVCRDLASGGFDQEAIWAGFRRATIAMGQFAVDVEDEQSSSGILKTDLRRRRSGGPDRRTRRAMLPLGRRNGIG